MVSALGCHFKLLRYFVRQESLLHIYTLLKVRLSLCSIGVNFHFEFRYQLPFNGFGKTSLVPPFSVVITVLKAGNSTWFSTYRSAIVEELGPTV